MCGELETRRNDKSYLLQTMVAKQENDFDKLLMWIRAKMEPEDVKLVLQEFEEWKKTLPGE